MSILLFNRLNIVIAAIILLQASSLLAIYQLLEHEIWLHQDSQSLLALLSVFIPIPIMALLLLHKDMPRMPIRALLVFALVFAAIGAYVGSQFIPMTALAPAFSKNTFIYTLTLLLACFKATMYLQQWAIERSFSVSYAVLFKYSWRNALTLCFSLLMVGIFWGILALWAALFNTLNIDIFSTIFFEDWFAVPVTVIAFGVGVVLFSRFHTIIDSLSRILQFLMKALLPLLAFVAVIFLLTLPFAGFSLLWNTGSGTTLVLWLQALLLFFLNAVYRDEPDTLPYSRWPHTLITFAVITLPFYSVIAFYGLYLRIDQYGWSLSRCWALLLCFLFACFAVGYCWGIIRRYRIWTAALSKVNVAMGLVVLVAMILINTPLLDFRKIATNSQFSRLAQARQAEGADEARVLANFDYYYAKSTLARPAYLKLKSLQTEVRDQYPEIDKKIDNLYKSYGNGRHVKLTKQEVLEQLITWPALSAVPEDITDYLWEKDYGGFPKRGNLGSKQELGGVEIAIIVIDLDKDGINDYLYLNNRLDSEHASGLLLYYEKNTIVEKRISIDRKYYELNDLLNNYDLEVTPPRWNSIKLGEIDITITP